MSIPFVVAQSTLENLNAEKIGVFILLVALVTSLVKGIIVPGYLYKATLADRDVQTKLAATALSLLSKEQRARVQKEEELV